MTEQEFQDALVDRINLETDIPFLNETLERRMIGYVVGHVTRFIPPQFRTFLINASDGLDESEIALIKEFVVNAINQYVDIPLLDERSEGMLIESVVNGALDFARQGMALVPVR